MADIDLIFGVFREVLMNGFTPDSMIMADPPGLEPGTYLLRKSEEPKRLADTGDFDRIWMTELGITNASIEKFADC